MGKRSAYCLWLWSAILSVGWASGLVWGDDTPPTGDAIVDLSSIEQTFVQLAQRVGPSVVAIETQNRSLDVESTERKTPDHKIQSLIGTGVVLSSDGLILTNEHVVHSAEKIFVILNDSGRYEGAVVGRDERSDLAVLKIEADGLTPAMLGDLEFVRIGQWALAMGNPFGMARDGHLALSYGIVSGLGKSLRSLEEDGHKYYGNLIQTTADIHPGNSGGPLFNIRGEMIGINTAIETKSGVSKAIGFAIPVNAQTRRIIEALSRGEEIKYGFLGINITEADFAQLRQVDSVNPWGVVVTRVFPSSPAEKAGLRVDDLIVRYSSEAVQNVDHLIRMVGATPVGETVQLVVFREGQSRTVEVTITEREAITASNSHH